MLLIYAPNHSNRLNYIASIFSDALGIKHLVNNNKDEFISYTGPRINYSPTPISDLEIHIIPCSLLFEIEIKDQHIECFNWNKTIAFFKTENAFGFDVFAAAFYLISRYEEYLPHQLDMYGRFAHENAVAFKNGFLHKPVVNIWINELKAQLTGLFPAIQFTPKPFKFIPTYDIDIAWSYLHKGVIRNAGGLIKSIFSGEFMDAKERIAVLINKKNDPFDIYEWLDKLHEKFNLSPIYFFLLSGQNKGYDKNINPGNKFFQQLIKQQSGKYAVGIHPSWQSGNDPKELQKEIELIKNITGKQIKKSRQHYIRMKLPTTYRYLIKCGISEDYSMGYGSINGFRASYCLPFKWFDVELNQANELIIFPFCFMEANSLFEQHYSAAQAIDELKEYFNEVRKVNGMFITIFHNHLITEQPQQVEWRNMYKEFIEKFISA